MIMDAEKVEQLLELTRRLIGMNQMLDLYATYPDGKFFIDQVQRKQHLCEQINLILKGEHKPTDTEEILALPCSCGLHENIPVQGTGMATEIYCVCQKRKVGFEIEP